MTSPASSSYNINILLLMGILRKGYSAWGAWFDVLERGPQTEFSNGVLKRIEEEHAKGWAVYRISLVGISEDVSSSSSSLSEDGTKALS